PSPRQSAPPTTSGIPETARTTPDPNGSPHNRWPSYLASFLAPQAYLCKTVASCRHSTGPANIHQPAATAVVIAVTLPLRGGRATPVRPESSHSRQTEETPSRT